MAKIKNKRIHSDDAEYLKRLAEELEYIGRHYRLDLKEGVLIQYALPPQKPKRKKEDKDKEREPRNKRAESAQRKA
jgi:hypothetical protein